MPLQPLLTVEEVNAYLTEVFPQMHQPHQDYLVTAIGPGTATVRLNATQRHLRPGDTISGPALFALADYGGYACALSHLGRRALAVTTNLNINFMRKAGPGAIDGDARILKLGKRLMVFEISIVALGDTEPIAHATGTYAIPPS